jgi:hypothetical protein
LLRAADFLPLMYAAGIVCILLRPDARRLGDLAGGTVVAYRRQPAAHGSFPPGGATQPSVALTHSQQTAIAAFAWRAGRMTPERAEEIALLGSRAAPGTATPMSVRLIGIARWLHGQRS